MGEVDQFLDEVEAELARLHRENEDLRAKLEAAQSAGSTGPATSPFAMAPPPPTPEPEPEPVPTPVPAAVAQPAETLKVETVADASNAAARLLEIATRNADELVEAAKNEADRIVSEAKTKAERMDSESKGRADRVEAEARQRAQLLDQETAERREQMFGDLEKERDKLNGEVETLRSFEREYRSRLKAYFVQQLESLESTGSLESSAAGDSAPAPKRLRSILGDDEG